jgi:hypothetical protein
MPRRRAIVAVIISLLGVCRPGMAAGVAAVASIASIEAPVYSLRIGGGHSGKRTSLK